MKQVFRVVGLAGLVGLVTACLPASAADVGVSVTVGDPGFFGRIDMGNAPRPVLVNPAPVLIAPAPRRVVQQPVYLHVPPGHAKHWAKHCARYDACGRPVYFVQENWYQTVYVPEHARFREHEHERERKDDHQREDDHGHGKGHGKDKHHAKGRH